MSQLVFVPVSRSQALSLCRDPDATLLNLTGQAATPSLLRAHDYDASTLEDAEYAALTYAGVLALTAVPPAGVRLVLAADLAAPDVSSATDDPLGTVAVSRLRWADVEAVFADEGGAGDAVARARLEAAGASLAEAVGMAEVKRVLEEHDLLWYAPQELRQLVGA